MAGVRVSLMRVLLRWWLPTVYPGALPRTVVYATNCRPRLLRPQVQARARTPNGPPGPWRAGGATPDNGRRSPTSRVMLMTTPGVHPGTGDGGQPPSDSDASVLFAFALESGRAVTWVLDLTTNRFHFTGGALQ